MNIRAVFFDVDGVLLDSLGPHLQICKDISVKYGLDIKIPDPETFKNSIVRKGIKISPMEFFFRVLGFSDLNAKMADQYYQNNFKDKYTVKPFPEVYSMLKRLKKLNIQLGIVTSNVFANIQEPLGKKIFNLFNKNCIFTKNETSEMSKSKFLKIGAKILNIDAHKIVYVGDQKSDYEEARTAGTHFVGVTYGWGFSKSDQEYVNIVNSCVELPDYIETFLCCLK